MRENTLEPEVSVRDAPAGFGRLDFVAGEYDYHIPAHYFPLTTVSEINDLASSEVIQIERDFTIAIEWFQVRRRAWYPNFSKLRLKMEGTWK